MPSRASGPTLAAYTHALDDGRTDDVVATFCPDGSIDIPTAGTFEGHDAPPRGLRPVDAAATPAPPRGQHPRHGLGRPPGHGGQRRGLRPRGQGRLGDPVRGPLPRHPSPRRRHVEVPPPESSPEGATMPDMSWVGVLEHHATPHARQAHRRLRRRRRHLPADGRPGRRRWRPGSRPGASARATSSACSRTTASSSWPRSSPPTTSARSPCRSTGGWRRRRCAFILDHSQARALVCDDELLELADDAIGRLDGDLVRVCHLDRGRRRAGSGFADVAGRRPPVPAGAGRRPTTSTG